MSTGRLAGIAALAMLVLAITVTSARAATFVRRDPGNVMLTAGSLLTADIGWWSDDSPSTSTGCNAASFSATVGTSGGSSVTATLMSFTLSSCTGSLGPMGFWSTITACHGVAPLGVLTLTGQSTTNPTYATTPSITFPKTTVRCDMLATPTTGGCYYQAPEVTGRYLNATRTLVYDGLARWKWTVPTGAADDLGATTCVADSSNSFRMEFGGIHTTDGTAVTVTTS